MPTTIKRVQRRAKIRSAAFAALVFATGFFALQPHELVTAPVPRGHAVVPLSPAAAWRVVSIAPVCGTVPLQNCPLTQLP